MKKIIGLMLLQASLSLAQHTKIDFIAEGLATAKAEFMKLNIKLEAQCQPSAQQSREALDELIQAVMEKIEVYKDTSVENQIQVLTNSPARKEIVKYLTNGQPLVLCSSDKGWTTEASIIFKITVLDSLPVVLDELLKIDQVSTKPNDPLNRISISKPEPGIFSTTYDQLSDLALSKALKSAQRQAQVIANELRLSKIALTKISAARDVSGAISYDRTSLGTDAEAAQLQSVTIQVSRNFSFVLSN